MKAKASFMFIALAFTVSNTYAGTGNASDGLIFTLIITGIFLSIITILFLIDFFKNNTRLIISTVIHWKDLLIMKLKELIDKRSSSFTLKDAHE